MGQISILGKEGDTRLIWDKTKPAEVEAARKMFDDLKAKGYMAFSVVERAVGDKGEQMKQFDPNAEKIIMAMAMAGGKDLLLAHDETTAMIVSGQIRWCRARLLHALAGAAEQGVLQEVIDELMSAPIPREAIKKDKVSAGGWEDVGIGEADGALVARWLIDAMEATGWMQNGHHVTSR